MLSIILYLLFTRKEAEVIKPADSIVTKYNKLISDFDESGSIIQDNLKNESSGFDSISEYDAYYADISAKFDKFVADITEINKLMDKVEMDLKITEEEYEEVSARIDLFLVDWEGYK